MVVVIARNRSSRRNCGPGRVETVVVMIAMCSAALIAYGS